MNYKELQQFSYECKVRTDYLFQELMIPRKQKNYEISDLIRKIKNHLQRQRINVITRKNLEEMVSKLKSMTTIQIEKTSNKEETSNKEDLMSMADISKKLLFDTSVIYRIFKDYPHFTIIKCQRRPNGMKAYNLHQIKDAFEIAIHKNIVPSKTEAIKKIYDKLPDFSNLGIYPLTDKQVRDVSQKMNFPELSIKPPETIIELQKETNNLLRQLLEIWRK